AKVPGPGLREPSILSFGTEERSCRPTDDCDLGLSARSLHLHHALDAAKPVEGGWREEATIRAAAGARIVGFACTARRGSGARRGVPEGLAVGRGHSREGA